MKTVLFTLLSLLIFTSCGNESAEGMEVSTPEKATETAASKSPEKIKDFTCETFFQKGDYSSLCFIDSKLTETISGGCIFDFVVKGDKQEQSIQIQFVDKKSTMLAEMHHNLNQNNYKKGEIMEVPNLGDAAYFDVHGTDLKSLSTSSKDLHVRYSNITFTLMAEYQSNTETPCFYSDAEMISFAKLIIENL